MMKMHMGETSGDGHLKIGHSLIEICTLAVLLQPW